VSFLKVNDPEHSSYGPLWQLNTTTMAVAHCSEPNYPAMTDKSLLHKQLFSPQ